ncbi:MAG: AraC family transcriptional regulator [Lachnospiraceae bacterium]|jgi:AraC-like DNA-binding protein/quercetin dioxygenase-like cupin family protein|nr:AraC family transcriptional regulator [Lachnospiraceae bacterium]
MGNAKNDKRTIDYYDVNSDWAGDRTVTDAQEIVQFHNNSTIRIWCNEQNQDYATHWHSAMEIIMPMENHYDVEINQISYHINPGEFLLIPPGEMHKLIAPDSGRRFILLFDISLITKLKGGTSIQALLLQPLFITKDGYPKIYDEVYRLLLDITDEYFSKNEYAELTIYSLLLSFFVKFINNRIQDEELFPNVRQSRQKEYIKKFNDLLDFINLHYSEELNLESMAARMGFSKFHFSRLFKQYTNLTFNDYLNFRRLKAAEELLANPALSIIEVSMRSGYSSISTFNRLFRQMKHCTPSEYRSKKRSGVPADKIQ